MGKTTELRREIKRAFVPLALERGFVLDQKNAPNFLEFKRIVGAQAQLFDIQWEKYGRPRFVLNFGVCPSSGLTIRGRHFAVEELLAGWLPGGRLQPGSGPGVSSWFRQDKPFVQALFSSSKLRQPHEVVAQLLELFPEVEAYWETGKIGKHLRVLPHRVA